MKFYLKKQKRTVAPDNKPVPICPLAVIGLDVESSFNPEYVLLFFCEIMDTLVDRVQLIHSSSDDSFEHIEPDYEDSGYQELRGVAVVDYCPAGSNEIELRKGRALASYLI